MENCDIDLMLNTIDQLHSQTEKEEFLKENYPVAYVNALKAMGRDESFLLECRDTVDNYTLYIVFYLEPLINKLRSENKLKHGNFLAFRNLHLVYFR